MASSVNKFNYSIHQRIQSTVYRMGLLFFLIFASPLSRWVEAKERVCMEIILSDGQTSEVYLDLNPTISFSHDNVLITGNNVDICLSYSDISAFRYVNIDQNGISNKPFLESSKISFTIHDKNIVVNGCTTQKNMSIYSINGILVKDILLYPNESQIISLRDLSQGIYVIKYDNCSLKLNIHE